MLGGRVEDAAAGQYRDYAGAEQATMAIGSLLAFLGRRGDLKNPRAASLAPDRLHATVKDDEQFSPERFRAALGRTVEKSMANQLDQRTEVRWYDIGIVGSGPAGLSAAAHAAELGVSHVLLEAEGHVSNTIHKYQRANT